MSVKMKADRSILKLVIVGVVIRLLLAAFLFHTDVKNIYLEAGFINSGWRQAYRIAADTGRPIYYPPLVYTLIEANRKISGFLFSDYFPTFLADGRAGQVLNHPYIFRDLLAMKIPWLLADLAIAFLLIRLVAEKNKTKVLWLWIFNPLTLYAVYGFANYDILPTLAMVFSLYLAKRNKWNLSYLALGLTAGLKLYGLLLFPVLWLIDQRGAKQKTVGLAGGLAIFFLSTATAWVDPFVFRSIFLSNLSNTLFGTRIELSDGFYIPIFLTLYAGFILWLAKQRKLSLVEGYSFVLGTLLAISYFNPQWVVWISPLLVLAVATQRSNWPAYLLIIAGYFLTVILFNDKFVALGMFKAMNNAFDSLNPLVVTVERFGLGEQLTGIGRALFLSGTTWLAVHAVVRDETDEDWKTPGVFISLLTLVLTAAIIFVGAHYVLTRNGHYILVDRDRVIPKFTLTSRTTISQRVETNETDINAIKVRLKNFILRTKETLLVKIANKDGSEVRNLPIGSGAIGDDFDLNLRFAPIKNPKGGIEITLTMPDAKPDLELFVPYDETFPEAGLFINGEPVKGSLAFTLYANPGGLATNLVYTLKRMLTRW
ncbi:MAG: glycosyltransferase family 87 protein [Patescibacteria group bacterium]